LYKIPKLSQQFKQRGRDITESRQALICFVCTALDWVDIFTIIAIGILAWDWKDILTLDWTDILALDWTEMYNIRLDAKTDTIVKQKSE